MEKQEPAESIGKYRLGTPISAGSGRAGTVYRATGGAGSEPIALRVIAQEATAGPWFADRCLRALQPYAAIQHPALLSPLELGQDAGRVYVAMPLETGTLRERLGTPRNIAEVSAILRPLAEALDQLHARRLVHGDIRPANILCAGDGRPLLADAGLAPALREANGFTLGDSAALVPGDPVYRAPEQFQFTPFDLRADRYAFGVIAYELLTGRPPFAAADPAGLAVAHSQTSPPAPSTLNPALPGALDAVFARALAKFPFERYDSAVAFCDAIDAAQPQLAATPASLPTTPAQESPTSLLTLADRPVPVPPAAHNLEEERRPPPAARQEVSAIPRVAPVASAHSSVTAEPRPRIAPPRWLEAFGYGPIEMLLHNRSLRGVGVLVFIFFPCAFSTICAGNIGLAILGILAIALGLGAYVALGPTTTVRCDAAGFSVERHNRIQHLGDASYSWDEVTALRYRDSQTTSTKGQRHLSAIFAVDAGHTRCFAFPGDLDQFHSLVTLCSLRCAHLPYEWLPSSEVWDRPVIEAHIAFSKVPRTR